MGLRKIKMCISFDWKFQSLVKVKLVLVDTNGAAKVVWMQMNENITLYFNYWDEFLNRVSV